jgi:hypothetical protein
MEVAKHKRVQLIWVLGDKGIEDNETADQLAGLGFECLFIGPERACGISAGIARKTVGLDRLRA